MWVRETDGLTGLILTGYCTGSPDTTADTYAHGATLIQTDSGTGSAAIYQNVGSSAVPSWQLMDTAGTSLQLPEAATDATTTTGVSLDLTQNAVTTGTGLLQTMNGLTTGKGHSITHTTAVIANGGSLLNLSSTSVDTTTTTGALVNLSSTAGAASTQVLLTTTGLTTGIGISVAHTTSVLASGGSLVRISSTGVDTGTTTGTLLDLTSSAHAGATLVAIRDTSADTSARIAFTSNITNAAAVGAIPIQSSNVAVTGTGSKFTKHLVMTDGSKTVTMWISTDGTTPNGALSGTAGDICLNGTSSVPFYCTGTTNWTALA